jgi:hypothetical protein
MTSNTRKNKNEKCNCKTMCFVGYFMILLSVIAALPINYSVQAETGIGDDVFKVTMTIFGVNESKGDVIAIVTAKNEFAKVKLFNASGPEVIPLNASGGEGLIEYVATFPNVTVNSGDVYKGCILTVKDLQLMCKSGNNSPAARPEFVDLTLNESSSGARQPTVENGDLQGDGVDNEEGETEDENNMDTADDGAEGSNASPGLPPIG